MIATTAMQQAAKNTRAGTMPYAKLMAKEIAIIASAIPYKITSMQALLNL